MGLFKRKYNHKISLDSETKPQTEPKYHIKLSKAQKRLVQNISYSVDDAIKLMNNVSGYSQAVTVAMMKNSMESSGAKIADILIDVEYEESKIGTQIKDLITEVRRLESDIQAKKRLIFTANSRMQELNKVNELLTLALKSQIADNLSSYQDIEPETHSRNRTYKAPNQKTQMEDFVLDLD